MKAMHTILGLIAAILAMPMAVAAPDQEPIDDIVVVGKKSMSELRRDVFESEEAFYEIYNQLNDEDEYDVRCFYETPTGTRQRNHVCRARFITDAFTAHAARNRMDVTRMANQDANPIIAEKSAKFQAKLETLIAANPDLQAALVRYNDARARFMEARDGGANN